MSLQTVCLQAPLGQTAKQTLPLKNAGNIDVLLKLKVPDELYFLIHFDVSHTVMYSRINILEYVSKALFFILAVFQSADGDRCFTVRPEELTLKAGEEQGVVVSFTAQDAQKHKERHVHSYRYSFCGC